MTSKKTHRAVFYIDPSSTESAHSDYWKTRAFGDNVNVDVVYSFQEVFAQADEVKAIFVHSEKYRPKNDGVPLPQGMRLVEELGRMGHIEKTAIVTYDSEVSMRKKARQLKVEVFTLPMDPVELSRSDLMRRLCRG